MTVLSAVLWLASNSSHHQSSHALRGFLSLAPLSRGMLLSCRQTDRQTDRNLLLLYAYMYSYSLVVVVFACGCAGIWVEFFIVSAVIEGVVSGLGEDFVVCIR